MESFYKGKTIDFYIGFSPGGTYDLFGRLVARHMSKHIPGNPTVVAQSMPGAGSFTLANWMYRIAPKDGTAMGIVAQTMAGAPSILMGLFAFSFIVQDLHLGFSALDADPLQDALGPHYLINRAYERALEKGF